MHSSTTAWGRTAPSAETGASLPAALLRVVDAGLCGVIFIAPYFLGGRHDFGRLVFVGLVAVTAAAWFARQAMLPSARWSRTAAHWLLLLTAAFVMLQIVPLPAGWLDAISPRTAQLLPLWTAGGDAPTQMGTWQTISLVPHETTKALAMLLSYSLLYVVVTGRIEDHADVERLLTWIGAAVALMAGVALLQHFTSNGKFLWLYRHPHRSATQSLAGPFINRNHFADFLVMGVGPLVSLLLLLASRSQKPALKTNAQRDAKQFVITSLIAAATALVVICILLSRSRGGAVALLVAGGALAALYFSRGLADSRFAYGFFGLAIVVGALLAIQGGDHALSRFDDIADGSVHNLDQGGIRQKLWTANIAAFEDAPLTGAGIGSHSDICQLYLPRYYTKEYTHAENSYLQIASEAGVGGLLLLAAAFGFVTAWCIGAWRRTSDERSARLLGATVAGLAASAAHSVVDFVWYIPACMSVVVILAASALRLSQLSQGSTQHAHCRRSLPRARWFELATAAVLVAAWSAYTYVGPGIAAIHWDRYLCASVENSKASQRRAASLAGTPSDFDNADNHELNDLMIRELEQVAKWNPRFARAHLKLAGRYLSKFDDEQANSENAISLSNICDAIAQSTFASHDAQTQWLERAVGPNLRWLRQAVDEARTAARLNPLQGEAYVYLAQLSFLTNGDPQAAHAYIDQALRVRPRNADVLFEIGREELAANNLEAALERWRTCFDDPGPHQRKIIDLVTGRIPASKVLTTFHPDWPMLRIIWSRYRDSGSVDDVEALVAYSIEQTRSSTQVKGPFAPAQIWYWQAEVFAEVGQADQALACLEQAYRCDARQYAIRSALARALHAAGRYVEAEPHYRWCLARRPTDKSLSAALVAISKSRLAERTASFAASRPPLHSAGVSFPAANSSSKPE